MDLCDAVLAPSGTLQYDVFRAGRLIESRCDRNLVVAGSKLLLARLLGGDVTGRSVTRIGFGTGGAPPVSADAALTAAYTKNTGAPAYTATAVTFPFTLDSGEANGLAIIEFGLLSTSGTLFSRRVRGSAINKAADISFIGSWTISF